MVYKIVLLSLTLLFSISTGEIPSTEASKSLPPIETFIMDPVNIENICMWIPAEKVGPVINNACTAIEESSSCVLPATVNHSKTDICYEEVARLLAEHTAYFHEDALPLTIFNGWQWEYLFSISQFDLMSYDLESRGGSWENSWEVLLTSSMGSIKYQWLQIANIVKSESKSDEKEQTNIEVITFKDMRTRDGYPKVRKLD